MVPPPLPTSTKSRLPHLLSILLSLCLGLFLIDAVVSLADDSLILFFGVHLLAGMRGLVFLFATIAAVAVYFAMGITPMIPKRVFLPLTFFSLTAQLAFVLFAIYFYGQIQQVAWATSLCEVLF